MGPNDPVGPVVPVFPVGPVLPVMPVAPVPKGPVGPVVPGVPIFPMTKDNFERYKEIFLNLSLNNPLLYMMFITKTIKDQIATEIKVLNIGYIKSFESQKAAYADIYNIEENTFRKLYQHRCPVYPANKPEN